MILIIKNISIEGPERLGEFFLQNDCEVREIDLSIGQKLPEDFSEIEAVICLGGPMNVYEEEKFPFLKEEDVFIRQVIEKEISFLGICLGSQLLAKACGAQVVKAPQKEIGFSLAFLTKHGQRDPLFEGMEAAVCVYQWHEDMFHVPDGAKWLATSDACPYQAFRVGKNAYGLQFHIEITKKSIEDWSDAYLNKNEDSLELKEAMFSDYKTKQSVFNQEADKLFQNFLNITMGRSSS